MSWMNILKQAITVFRDNRSKEMVDLKNDLTPQDAKRIKENEITCINSYQGRTCGTVYTGKNSELNMDNVRTPHEGSISFHAQCPVCKEWNFHAELELGDFMQNEPSYLEIKESDYPKSVSPYSRVDREFGRR